jgi:hypothetical protein
VEVHETSEGYSVIFLVAPLFQSDLANESTVLFSSPLREHRYRMLKPSFQRMQASF